MERNGDHISNDYLVLRYQQGDKDALKVLIRQFDKRIRAQVIRQTGDSASLDDLAQESWYAIIQGLGSVRIKISFEVWALSIARRKGIDWIRSQKKTRSRFSELTDDVEDKKSEDLADIEQRASRVAQLRTSINSLPHTQRMVLSMFYLENLSIKEISEILKISHGTVKSRLFNARELLKKTLNQSLQ